jgi:hypothetical protein
VECFAAVDADVAGPGQRSASDGLVAVWKLLAAGRETEARASYWEPGASLVDALAGEQAADVALRLLKRLAPSTDDPKGWAQLPDEIAVFRAGEPEGFSWTIRRYTAESVARRLASELGETVPIHSGVVDKQDVLAYITGYGEDEIVAPWSFVRNLSGPNTGPHGAQGA